MDSVRALDVAIRVSDPCWSCARREVDLLFSFVVFAPTKARIGRSSIRELAPRRAPVSKGISRSVVDTGFSAPDSAPSGEVLTAPTITRLRGLELGLGSLGDSLASSSPFTSSAVLSKVSV